MGVLTAQIHTHVTVYRCPDHRQKTFPLPLQEDLRYSAHACSRLQQRTTKHPVIRQISWNFRLNAAIQRVCGAVILPSAATAHRTRSESIPADSRQLASIPAAWARHLLLKHLPTPPGSLLCAEHPSPAPSNTPGWPVRPVLTPGAISCG